jgi:hypothetical protein
MHFIPIIKFIFSVILTQYLHNPSVRINVVYNLTKTPYISMHFSISIKI